MTDPIHSLPIDRFAHDLRQPLRAIMVSIQQIQRQNPPLPSESLTRLDELLAAARRQEELIASVLEFDMALRDGLPADTPMPLSLILEAAVHKVEPYRKLRNGIIRVGDCPSTFASARIAKALEKLLHNALKFQAPDATPTVYLDATADEDSPIVVRVTDNGVGIEAQYRESVFEPFSRLHPASAYPGAGLGLSICRLILESLHGTVAFEEPAGPRGALAVIRVPAASA